MQREQVSAKWYTLRSETLYIQTNRLQAGGFKTTTIVAQNFMQTRKSQL